MRSGMVGMVIGDTPSAVFKARPQLIIRMEDPQPVPKIHQAFIISQTESTYKIIIEDSTCYEIKKPITNGDYTLNDGKKIFINDLIFTPHRLFMACKGYEYDLRRKRKAHKNK